jgi:4a-hydroxytetrahydrobiopterin dehydratase
MSPFPPEDLEILSAADLRTATAPTGAAAGWVVDDGMLRNRFATGDFTTGVAMIVDIGSEADRVDHHPDVDLRYGHLDIALTSHDVRGITRRDLRLAHSIATIAQRHGVAAILE